MKDLKHLREEIDRVNKGLVELFIERMKISEEIGEYKREKGMKIYDKKREEEIIAETIQGTEEKYKGYVSDFLKELMKMSRDIQEGSRVKNEK
ncbi:chorismate mutase [Oceanirhabdus sp. W0125-5]|uniref:chorismate mutase n=1 Tax=Oceanirhabdus sp. W0125-5 TaxID=2999116 RepID=UPI0022F2E1FC|nr:chorismate mutase [Oceanirhabdus sp. W0125-5]WBW99352.1 chorismate mutase [Oceanirhabdus sp. W0125-5]